MIAIAILKRRLREGRTYEEFRRAWFHEEGFQAPNRMLTALSIADPREVIVIGLTEVASAADGARLIGIDQQERGASPLDEIIEPDISRDFGLLVAADDFSAAGPLGYTPAIVDGRPADFEQIAEFLALGRQLLSDYLTMGSRH